MARCYFLILNDNSKGSYREDQNGTYYIEVQNTKKASNILYAKSFFASCLADTGGSQL